MTITYMLAFVQTLLTVAALIYVAQQTKYLRQSIQGATYQNILLSVAERIKMYIEHPELAEIYPPGHYGSPEKTPQETSKKWMAIWLSDTYENVFIQHKEGTFSDKLWQSLWAQHIILSYRTTMLKDLWPKIKQAYSAEYQEFIDNGLALH